MDIVKWCGAFKVKYFQWINIYTIGYVRHAYHKTVDKVTVNLKNIMKSFITFPMGLKDYTNISIEENVVS